jgi:hypothetical protein
MARKFEEQKIEKIQKIEEKKVIKTNSIIDYASKLLEGLDDYELKTKSGTQQNMSSTAEYASKLLS